MGNHKKIIYSAINFEGVKTETSLPEDLVDLILTSLPFKSDKYDFKVLYSTDLDSILIGVYINNELTEFRLKIEKQK